MTPDAGSELPVAECRACGREVLCFVDLDDQGREVSRCLECSVEIAADQVRWLDLAAIETLGYGFVLPAAGCGRPDCGQGRCGRASPAD